MARPVALILAVILLAGAGCRVWSEIDSAQPRSNLAIRIAAFVWPSLTTQDLLFPVVAVGATANLGRRRCVPSGASVAAPWLEEAVQRPICSDLLREVVRHGTSPDGFSGENRQDLLTAAAICDDAASIAALLASGTEANRVDSCGATALVAAASAGSVHAVETLLRKGANPNLTSSQGAWSRSPLLAALVRGNPVIAGELLRSGATPNTSTPEGRSALMFAAALGDEGLVRDLLRRKASPCRRDVLGWLPVGAANAHGAATIAASLRTVSSRCDRDADGAE